jgi:transcriptional regulator with XRE-family HTH domain
MDGMNEPMMPERRRRTYSENLDVALGQRIRRLRLIRNMSQNDLARHLGMTFQQIQKYEMGRNRISVGSMVMIAQALDTSVALLMHGLEAHLELGTQGQERSPADKELIEESRLLAEGLEMMGLFNAIGSAEARSTLRSLAVMLQALPEEGRGDSKIPQRSSRARLAADDSRPALMVAE